MEKKSTGQPILKAADLAKLEASTKAAAETSAKTEAPAKTAAETPVKTETPKVIAVEATTESAAQPGSSLPNTPMGKMLGQIRKDTGLLFSGLAVLVKDTSEHLSLRGYGGAMEDEFRHIFSKTLDEDRLYLESYQSDVFRLLEKTGLPHGIVANADDGRYDVALINPPAGKEDKLGSEWLRRLGWSFYKNYSPLFEPIFSGADMGGSLSANDEILRMADRFVANKKLEEDTWWFPFVLYMSTLMVHIDRVK